MGFPILYHKNIPIKEKREFPHYFCFDPMFGTRMTFPIDIIVEFVMEAIFILTGSYVVKMLEKFGEISMRDEAICVKMVMRDLVRSERVLRDSRLRTVCTREISVLEKSRGNGRIVKILVALCATEAAPSTIASRSTAWRAVDR